MSLPNPLKPGVRRCSWSSTDRRCSNYIWVINTFIAYYGATYIRGLTYWWFDDGRSQAISGHGINSTLSPYGVTMPQLTWGSFHWRLFARNSNSMGISLCLYNSVAGHQIEIHFCTCHDSTAVVSCAKFYSDHCIRIEVKVKRNFHRIWIALEKSLVRRDLAYLELCPTSYDLGGRAEQLPVGSEGVNSARKPRLYRPPDIRDKYINVHIYIYTYSPIARGCTAWLIDDWLISLID